MAIEYDATATTRSNTNEHMSQTNEKIQKTSQGNRQPDKIRHTRTQTRPTENSKMDKATRITPRMANTRQREHNVGKT